jgi:hypothetical protein
MKSDKEIYQHGSKTSGEITFSRVLSYVLTLSIREMANGYS